MKIKVVPGFHDLLGKSEKTYEEILKDVPTDIVIRLVISLNAELNTNESHSETQARLRNIISYRFSASQIALLENAFAQYKMKVSDYDGTVFGQRYLVHMMSKELNRNSTCKMSDDEPQQEFNFLLAYLLCIDEVHEITSKLIQELQIKGKDELTQVKMLWKSLLNQYEFNEDTSGSFELYKLVCFFKYGVCSLRPYIRELLNKNGFKTLSDLLGSLLQLVNATLKIDTTQILQKLYFIEPNKNYNYEHLANLSINKMVGTGSIGIAEIKKFPLFETENRGFMILDESMFKKKIYKGPLFETFHSTSLKQETESKISNPSDAFVNYKSKVSKEALEKLCFRGIIKSAQIKKGDVLHFDETLKSLPDMYFRRGKKIVIIEFKDYLFPDRITDANDADSLLNFIDNRFIQNESGKKKGILQLADNIELLYQGHYSFDAGLKKLLDRKCQLDICAIVCYSDFMIGIPGVNDYLNIRYNKEIGNRNIDKKIRNVTLLNLQTLFDYIISGGGLLELKSSIDRYCKIIENRKDKFKQNQNADNFLKSKASFEEVYRSLFLRELEENKSDNQRNGIGGMLTAAGITDKLFSEVV
ncbi:MAG: hypothetical protein ABIX01_18785 [Chitinophagaceae bacterium]